MRVCGSLLDIVHHLVHLVAIFAEARGRSNASLPGISISAEVQRVGRASGHGNVLIALLYMEYLKCLRWAQASYCLFNLSRCLSPFVYTQCEVGAACWLTAAAASRSKVLRSKQVMRKLQSCIA